MKRLEGLDLFKIMCFLVVCAFHTTLHLGCDYGILNGVSIMGAMFMTAFFMLSGFTLNYTYKDVDLKQIDNIKKFLVKRIISIVPLYYISSIIYVLIQGKETLIENILLAPVEALLLQNTFSTLFPYTHNGGTWFISSIMICYIIFPYIQELVKQMTKKNKLIIFVICVMILLYAPIIVGFFGTQDIYANPFYRILEFFLGIILASEFENIKENKLLKKIMCNYIAILVELILFSVAVSVCVIKNFKVGNYMLYSWIGIPMYICMLISFAGAKSKFMENNKLIKYVSSLAYPFFLAQLFSNWISRMLISKFDVSDNIVRIIIGWSICIFIAIFLHEVIEKPITKGLKKIWRV